MEEHRSRQVSESDSHPSRSIVRLSYQPSRVIAFPLLSAVKSLPTEKYRKEMAKLQERKLSPTQRTVIAIVAAHVLAATAFRGWLAANIPMFVKIV
jgi:hypothetical protein